MQARDHLAQLVLGQVGAQDIVEQQSGLLAGERQLLGPDDRRLSRRDPPRHPQRRPRARGQDEVHGGRQQVQQVADGRPRRLHVDHVKVVEDDRHMLRDAHVQRTGELRDQRPAPRGSRRRAPAARRAAHRRAAAPRRPPRRAPPGAAARCRGGRA